MSKRIFIDSVLLVVGAPHWCVAPAAVVPRHGASDCAAVEVVSPEALEAEQTSGEGEQGFQHIALLQVGLQLATDPHMLPAARALHDHARALPEGKGWRHEGPLAEPAGLATWHRGLHLSLLSVRTTRIPIWFVVCVPLLFCAVLVAIVVSASCWRKRLRPQGYDSKSRGSEPKRHSEPGAARGEGRLHRELGRPSRAFGTGSSSGSEHARPLTRAGFESGDSEGYSAQPVLPLLPQASRMQRPESVTSFNASTDADGELTLVEEPDALPPLFPPLTCTKGETLLLIPLASLARLGAVAHEPHDIYGPSGYPFLQARARPSSGGMRLEVGASRMGPEPQVCIVEPWVFAAGAADGSRTARQRLIEQSVLLSGPDGRPYGTLAAADTWESVSLVHSSGELIMSLFERHGRSLVSIYGRQGRRLAAADMQAVEQPPPPRGSGGSSWVGPRVAIKVGKGVDPVLITSCMLVMFAASSELRLRVGLPFAPAAMIAPPLTRLATLDGSVCA